jgi:GR25 family glycosyltransferase involved in LPS biosynthesis
MNIPIFCINLERAIERKEFITKKWIDELGLDITFWKAYDRRDIENNKFIYPYNKQLAIQTIGRQLSNGEIACATSFCMLYEFLIEKKYNEVLIMEDDIVPNFIDKSVLFNKIEIIKKEFTQTEMILLHNMHPVQMQSQKNEIFYDKKIESSLCKIAPFGNQLFYIKLNAIKIIYDILKTMSMAADHPQDILAKENLVCIANNPLCNHEWIGINSNTYIGNEYRNTHRRFIE